MIKLDIPGVLKEHGTCVAIGTFDGIHTGHQLVLDTLMEISQKKHLTPVVISFTRHPLEVVAPEQAPKLLSLPRHRIQRLKQKGCTPLLLDFNEQLASCPAKEWISLLHDQLQMRSLIIGYDNTFGSDGLDKSVDDFRSIGHSLGVEIVAAPVREGVSSSEIRRAICQGEISKANEMLGYHYSLDGIVVNGNSLGHQLGFPTANIQPDPRLIIPHNGVYLASVEIKEGEQYNAVVNIGTRPTLGPGHQSTIEAHLLDYSGSLYTLEVRVSFIQRLRDEQKFQSLADLSAAINKDVQNARKIIESSTK